MSGFELLAGAVVSVAVKGILSPKFLDFSVRCNINPLNYSALDSNFTSVHALLIDADKKPVKDATINDWIKRARYAIYEAEDTVDQIVAEFPRPDDVSHPPPKQRATFLTTKVIRKIHPTKKSLDEKLNVVITNLRIVKDGATELNLKGNKELVDYRNKRESTSLKCSSQFHGRSDVKEVIEIALDSREGYDDVLRIVPIVGMGGIGKTELAHILFHNYESKSPSHIQNIGIASPLGFQVKCWVWVSDMFDHGKVIRKILESITTEPSEPEATLEKLQQNLMKHLKGKRFLIVLDDVWDTIDDNWENFEKLFSGGAPGSRIIVTTRDEKVARVTSTNMDYIYHLKVLTDDDCWLMFKDEKALKHFVLHRDLMGPVETIIKNCKGLPLAVKKLGSRLNSSRDKCNGYESKIKCLQDNFQGENDTAVLQSLWLSYYHLPNAGKRCFAYLSTFPKGYLFSRETLVLLWMAEGFVEAGHEYLAEEYFDLLADKFLVKQEKSNRWLVVHDRIHDLAIDESKGLCNNLSNQSEEPNPQARRLSYSQNKDEEHVMSEQVQNLCYVRTFLPLGQTDPQTEIKMNIPVEFLSNFKRLRVLSLRFYGIVELPESIGDMRLLKYLDVSGTHIRRLRERMCNLYDLQTLLLHGCKNLKTFPKKIKNLVNIRHLSIKHSGIEDVKLDMELYGFKKRTDLGEGYGEVWWVKPKGRH